MIYLKKRFGQHFLTDKNDLQKILSYTGLSESDVVLEIGAGSGLLTCELAKKVKKIYAIEIERDALRLLKENLEVNKIKNVETIETDFLKLDINVLMQKSSFASLKIVGNIPYNITSPILIKLFGEIDSPASHIKYLDEVYLMLQKEVAERFIAKSGTREYSPITILVQYFSNPKILFYVSKNSFYPSPKVESAFVKFSLKKTFPKIADPKLLKKIIRTAFQHRRKKIVNALQKIFTDKKEMERMLNALEINLNSRPEDLEFSQYIKIADSMVS